MWNIFPKLWLFLCFGAILMSCHKSFLRTRAYFFSRLGFNFCNGHYNLCNGCCLIYVDNRVLLATDNIRPSSLFSARPPLGPCLLLLFLNDHFIRGWSGNSFSSFLSTSVTSVLTGARSTTRTHWSDKYCRPTLSKDTDYALSQ